MRFPWGQKALCEQSMSVSPPVKHMSVMGRWIVAYIKFPIFFRRSSLPQSSAIDEIVLWSIFWHFFSESNHRRWVCCWSIQKLTFGSNLYWQGLLCTCRQSAWQLQMMRKIFHVHDFEYNSSRVWFSIADFSLSY